MTLAQCPICGAPRAYQKFEQRWVCSVDPEHGEALGEENEP